MKIPSYDDLAPSITDVHPRETFDFAARVVAHGEAPVVRAVVAQPALVSSQLFACLRMRGPARPGALMGLARDFSPRVERYGDSCVVLDVAGLGRLLGDAHGIAAELARTAGDRGVKVQIAVVPTQTAARVLALVADDLRVVTSDPAAALASLPLHLLGVCGLSEAPEGSPPEADRRARASGGGAPRALIKDAATPRPASPGLSGVEGRPPVIFDVLKRWGLRTIGELAALAPDEIAARFGATGVAMHRRALGLDPRPLIPDPGVPRFMQSMELEWPIEELEPLSFVLARLLEPLSLALERADKGAAAIRLDLRLTDKTTHTRMLQLPASMRDARVLRTLLLLDLESHPPAAGIDVVTIEVDPAPGRIVQFSLLERAAPAPETIATLTARLGALAGEDRCGSPVLVDSHRPDAFEMKRFGPAPRPQVPTAPKLHGPSLRRFRPPVAIRVTIDRGRPAQVPIDRKGMPGGRVEQCAGPWRTSGAWWDASGQAWDRDEWDVEFADGSVCRIFHARDSGVWFMEGVVD